MHFPLVRNPIYSQVWSILIKFNPIGTSTTSSQSSNWSEGCPASIKLNNQPILSEPTDAVVINAGKFTNDKFLLSRYDQLGSEPDKLGRNSPENSREGVEENRTRILYAFDQTAFNEENPVQNNFEIRKSNSKPFQTWKIQFKNYANPIRKLRNPIQK